MSIVNSQFQSIMILYSRVKVGNDPLIDCIWHEALRQLVPCLLSEDVTHSDHVFDRVGERVADTTLEAHSVILRKYQVTLFDQLGLSFEDV